MHDSHSLPAKAGSHGFEEEATDDALSELADGGINEAALDDGSEDDEIVEDEAEASPTRAYEEPSSAPVRRPMEAQPLTQSARALEHTPDGTRNDERLERGLAQLVLTVVELLRKLMERQAVRRVEAGTLEPERVERLGRAFERLQQQMSELKQQFELGDDDLTLRLGPLPGLESEDAR